MLCPVLGPSVQKGHEGAGVCPEKSNGAGEMSGEKKSYEKWLRELVVFSLNKRRLRGNLIVRSGLVSSAMSQVKG